jgi:hypothetical protein
VARPLFSRGARVLGRVPVGRVLAAAELVALARQHLAKLEPSERRRVLELLRAARGRPANLSQRQRRELSALIAKAEPGAFVSGAIEKVTGVPLRRGGRAGRWRPPRE